jgi:hypothetical protein
MKYLVLLFVATTVLAGCANEAYYTDREYGVASMDAYDRQIVHKDYVHANKTADDMDGIHAELTMEMYHNSFSEGFTQETIETLSPGSDTGSN